MRRLNELGWIAIPPNYAIEPKSGSTAMVEKMGLTLWSKLVNSGGLLSPARPSFPDISAVSEFIRTLRTYPRFVMLVGRKDTSVGHCHERTAVLAVRHE